MSREYPDAVDAFVRRHRRSAGYDGHPDGPEITRRRAVARVECGPETDPTVRAAAAVFAQMRGTESCGVAPHDRGD